MALALSTVCVLPCEERGQSGTWQQPCRGLRRRSSRYRLGVIVARLRSDRGGRDDVAAVVQDDSVADQRGVQKLKAAAGGKVQNVEGLHESIERGVHGRGSSADLDEHGAAQHICTAIHGKAAAASVGGPETGASVARG